MSAPVRTVAGGRFELREQLGISSTATVWRAFDQKRRREVCLKLLHPQLLSDRAARRRIVAEASAAGRLNHPNIVSPLESDFSGDSAALVFPLVEGETLAVRIAHEGRLPATEVARIGAEVAEALAHAHAKGVVHRDVKPGNIMLGTDGRVYLLDFGIAASQEQAAMQLTDAGTAVGTLPYMAPEQLAAHPAEPASDVFSLGAVLYEMLAGRRPYVATTPVALVQEQQRQPADIPDVPPALLALAMLALSSDPAARPPAEAMAASLRDWRTALPDAVTAAVFAPPTAILGAAAPPSGANRRKGVLAGLAAAGLAALVVAAFALGPAFGPPEAAAPVSPTPAPSPTSTPTPSPTPTPTATADNDTVSTPKPKPKPNKGKGKGRGHGNNDDDDDD
jgi:serine/threonine protein kinase